MPPLALVVQDEPPVRWVTCQLLESGGFQCVEAESGIDAIRLIGSGTVPDLMVLDIRLPDMPGPAVALGVHYQHPHIPVLFVSRDELADPNTLAPLRWDFLQKPFTGEALVTAARRLLG